jgi:hypothetical protein
MQQPATLHDYLSRGLPRVDGWLSRLDADLICAISSEQANRGVRGTVGEIGIHHGKLLILLSLLRQSGEAAVAIDLFADQASNVDRSGEGNRAAFEANMARFGGASDNVVVIEGNSLALSWQDLSRRVQPLRLFSVDGGHTAECAYHDLGIAEDGLTEGGVIVLDDYFNAEFPGVSEGCVRFLVDRPGRLQPFAIGDNKLFFCRKTDEAVYVACIRKAVRDNLYVKDVDFCGSRIPLFRTPQRLYDKVKQSQLAKRYRDSPFGKALKPYVRRLLARS